MKTGIKTLVKKTVGQIKHPSLFYSHISKQHFPEKAISPILIESKLRHLTFELQERRIPDNLGTLYTVPHPVAVRSYTRFVSQNPGNLGNWSQEKPDLFGTAEIEYEVIHKLIDLYHGDQKKLGGYITSGGTEGNIFATWMGRSYLEHQKKITSICLLRTSLTHYSIKKAAHITRVPEFIVPLNKELWNMDVQGFEKTVLTLRKKGYRGFLVPFTFGYTSTGTSDNSISITTVARSLQKKYGLEFFFWIDAALNGLIAPFQEKFFAPFDDSSIQAVIVDFHKFGLVPYSAGILLYRNALLKGIEQPIDYLPMHDATLLGSRPGTPAVSIWTMMHTLGKSGYRDSVEEQMRNKQYFQKQMQTELPTVSVITDAESLSCGLMFPNRKHMRLPPEIEEKYHLYPGKTKITFYPNMKKEYILYKCYFLPHMKRHVIKEFIADLSRIEK